jgi:hypothetical protein
MFCPYCQRAVVSHESVGDDADHRWCFIHLHDYGVIKKDGTPKEATDSFYALCSKYVPRKSKVRRIKLTSAQRTTTVPGPLKLSRF